MFFLTYHKVVSDAAAAGQVNFYTVAQAQFARQLELLQARGGECLPD